MLWLVSQFRDPVSAFTAVLEPAGGVSAPRPLHTLDDFLARGRNRARSQRQSHGRSRALHEPVVFLVEHVNTVTQADELKHLR